MLHRRLRTLTLWTGTLVSLLIAAAFVVSAWVWAWIVVSGDRFMGVNAGALECYSRTLAARPGYMRHGAGLQLAG